VREQGVLERRTSDAQRLLGRHGSLAVINPMNPTAQQPPDFVETTDASSAADSLLTADEVATLLQVTPAWVYAETRRRRIPHLRLGRYVRYRRIALEGWIEEMERSSGRYQPSRRR
jgi:excisionase family DNA binding protein